MGERKKTKPVAHLAPETTFEGIAREWFARERQRWVDAHGKRILRRLERDVFLRIGDRPISDISPQEMLAVLTRTQDRGAIETARRAKWECSQRRSGKCPEPPG